MRKLLSFIKFTIGAMVLGVAAVNFWIKFSTKDQVFHDVEDVPKKDVALILGTSKKMIGGKDNQFFHKRMQAAAELYHNGKVKHILVSGDNRTQYYNEPQDMLNALVSLNVPEDAITLDYAGLSTFDSVVRSKEIFGQNNILIITQEFHSHRALFIANHIGQESATYVADFPEHEGAIKIVFREYFARVKAVLDLYVLQTVPKHLGDKEEILIN